MAANTYVALATTTLGTASSAVTLSSIPAGYTDLVMVINLANTSNTGLWVTVNGDTGNNYSGTRLWGNGSAVGTDRQSNYGSFILTVGDGKETIVHFQNYSNTTTNKTMISRHSSPYSDVGANVGLWRSTAAINSITVNSSPAMAIGTTISIYGIAAASVGAKATGGAIYQDATYFYHVFSGNGTFTPSQTLTCDLLVVAGGGGTYGQVGGPGGAGGLLVQSGRTVTAASYAVGIGAGGPATSPGSNTTIFSIVANGGGRGGDSNGTTAGGNGGSGGGATYNGTVGGTATQGNSDGATGYGFAGGVGSQAGGQSTGGGGGAGAAGTNASGAVAGKGGDGRTDSLIQAIGLATGTGQNVSGTYYFAGGGGGATVGGTVGQGGYGGGGIGGLYPSGSPDGANGLANTGGGGGGRGTVTTGTSGGSGIVVIRYAK